MKKTITILVIVALIIIAAFFYLTRPVTAPTENIQSASETLPEPTEEGTLYRIAQDDSTASFQAKEILNDKPASPVGVTHDIAGDISIEGNKITMGTIKINAKTFVTDSEKRDGAVSRFILKTEEPGNEYITFKPTKIEGAPAMIEDGKEFTVKITGDLTISGVTKPAVFTTKMTVTDEKITGSASSSLKRSDYGLKIPSVPSVASVDDEIALSATITANKVQ